MVDRHPLHMVIRGAIARWNDRVQLMHMGHKIDLGAEITEAVMEHMRAIEQLNQRSDK